MSRIQNAVTAPAIPRRADPYRDKTSLEFRFRARRFEQIQRMIQDILDENGSAHILDLGGTETYWLIGEEFIQDNRDRLQITMVNTEAQILKQPGLFTCVRHSATDPALFREQAFDLVHSNSVVEHVGIWKDMTMFADNVRRLAPRYYVQTPNYWFPFEPHFRTVGFQYLPERVRVMMLRRFALGFFQKFTSDEDAWNTVWHHRLISTRQMRKLFPDAMITHEKVLHLNKSIVAVRDVPAQP